MGSEAVSHHKAFIGGVLGVALGLSVTYGFGLQAYTLLVVLAGLFMFPILLLTVRSQAAVVAVCLSALFCINGMVVFGKYRERRFVDDVIDNLTNRRGMLRDPASKEGF
jgi:uncharacterized membrane protein YccC